MRGSDTIYLRSCATSYLGLVKVNAPQILCWWLELLSALSDGTRQLCQSIYATPSFSAVVIPLYRTRAHQESKYQL